MQDITLSDAIPFVRINRIPEKFSKGAIQYVVTNIFGESIVLRDTECADYLSNTLTDVDLKKDLEDRLFYKSPDYEDRAHIEYQKRFGVNFIGPTLHIIVLTKGCNHQCKYCHAAADYRFEDDSLKMESTTSEKVVDIIFQSPGQLLTIEFQ